MSGRALAVRRINSKQSTRTPLASALLHDGGGGESPSESRGRRARWHSARPLSRPRRFQRVDSGREIAGVLLLVPLRSFHSSIAEMTTIVAESALEDEREAGKEEKRVDVPLPPPAELPPEPPKDEQKDEQKEQPKAKDTEAADPLPDPAEERPARKDRRFMVPER